MLRRYGRARRLWEARGLGEALERRRPLGGVSRCRLWEGRGRAVCAGRALFDAGGVCVWPTGPLTPTPNPNPQLCSVQGGSAWRVLRTSCVVAVLLLTLHSYAQLATKLRTASNAQLQQSYVAV